MSFTVLVFGKDGQLGQALASAAASRLEAVKLILLGRSEADLSDSEQCAEIIASTDADVVVNAAAMTGVVDAETRVDGAMAINGSAPGVLAAAAVARRLPFIQVSTDYVFGGDGNRPWCADDETRPGTVYGQSKRVGEQGVVAAYEDTDIPYVVLRTSWVISARGKNFASTMLKFGEEKGKVSVVADQIGGPTPADDLASAILQISEYLTAGMAPRGIYHYSGTPDVSWADLARAIFDAAGQSVMVEDVLTKSVPGAINRPLNSRLDCTAIERDFDLNRPDWRAALPGIVGDLKKVTQLAKSVSETA